MTSAAVTIYDTIGGLDAVSAVVEDFYDRVLADPELAPFFVGTNMGRLKEKQTEFISAALGGPIKYTGQSMKDAHRGRGIHQEHFNLVAGHLADALSAAGVPDDLVGQIIEVVKPLSEQIVSHSA